MDGLDYFQPYKMPLDEPQQLLSDENIQSQNKEIQHEPTILVDNNDPVLSGVEELGEQSHESKTSYIPENHRIENQPLVTVVSDRQAEGCDVPRMVPRDGSTSSSNSSSDDTSSPPTLYDRDFLAPTIHYDRDNISQKLIALIGREFDKPAQIAADMQGLLQKHSDNRTAKFVPFTVRRKTLLKGTFDTRDLKQHDLICFCYNASEARILLTGPDGFYSTLLRLVEALLGPNKVAFIVSNYSPPGCVVVDSSNELISPVLQTRLHNQDSLKRYLGKDQVLSWKSAPSVCHLDALLHLANLECNPVNACVLL